MEEIREKYPQTIQLFFSQRIETQKSGVNEVFRGCLHPYTNTFKQRRQRIFQTFRVYFIGKTSNLFQFFKFIDFFQTHLFVKPHPQGDILLKPIREEILLCY